MSEKRRNKGGRNPKLDPAVFRYTVRFSEEEHNRFLSMFEKSGVYAKVGFDWQDSASVWAKVQEELGELQEALQAVLPSRIARFWRSAAHFLS